MCSGRQLRTGGSASQRPLSIQGELQSKTIPKILMRKSPALYLRPVLGQEVPLLVQRLLLAS